MHAMTALGFAAVLAFLLVGPQEPRSKQEPQAKEVAVPGAMPRLADILKGFVGQDCMVGRGDCGFELDFDPASKSNGQRKKLELVGHDFVKLTGELIVPFSYVTVVIGRKP